MTATTAPREMPRYKCHKEVWALEITEVVFPEIESFPSPPVILKFEKGDMFAPIEVSMDWAKKHSPKPGGYYVVYADGYKSFSPAEAFEDGYTLVS